MKKYLISILVIVITIGIYACKKDTSKMQSDTNFETQYTDFEWEVYHKLEAYKLKKNSNLKGLNPISLDSAEWYMETQFNVEKAYTEDPFKMVRLDTTYYSLPINRDELVEYSDMNAMYNRILNDLDSLEIIIADPYVFPYIGILSLVSASSSKADFRLILGFGSTYSGYYISIEEDDNWRWGNMKGHCDGTNFGDSDAGQELINRINNPLITWVNPGSFIEHQYRSITYDEYPDVNQQNPNTNVHYMIYYEVTDNNNWPCIEYDELGFYLGRLHEIIYTVDYENIPNTTTLYGKKPPGKVFVPGFLTIYTPDSIDGTNHWWEHKFWMRYATRVNLPLPK